MNKFARFVKQNRVSVVGALLITGLPAFAVSEFDPITAAVSWTTVGAAIIAIAALKAAPKVVAVGSKMVLSMIGR